MDVVRHVHELRQERGRNSESLETKKRWFLSAMGKAEPSNDDITQFPLHRTLGRIINGTSANITAKKILQQNSCFDLGHYLACAKAIYLISGRRPGTLWVDWEKNIDKAFTYILTHARLFGDQKQHMFQLEGNPSLRNWSIKSHPLPNTKYMSKITALINDLMPGYDETKYRILNANVTYFTLLILRRFVQDEMQFSSSFECQNTRDDYVKLCPQTLDRELPRISQHFIRNMNKEKLNAALYLAIYAFLTVKDDTSKTILRVTCLEYMEWHDMQLPALFFKVVSLYGLEEARLWDLLISEKTSKSLSVMADVYYYHHHKNTSKATAKPGEPKWTEWFPYSCAFEDPDTQCKLSGSQNVYLCTLLAYIIDVKIGLDKSFIRNSAWADNRVAKKTGLKIAQAFQQFSEK